MSDKYMLISVRKRCINCNDYLRIANEVPAVTENQQ